MSIQSEISRIETAKANLKTAIEAKGGTIADGTSISAYAEILNGIAQSPTLKNGTGTIRGNYNGVTVEIGFTPVAAFVQAAAENGGKNFQAAIMQCGETVYWFSRSESYTPPTDLQIVENGLFIKGYGNGTWRWFAIGV